MRIRHVIVTAVVLAALAAAVPAQAQQVTVGNRFHTLSDSFFENNSINWSGNYRGVTFSFGGANLTKPQFGGADPSAGLSANYAIVGKDGQIGFNMNFGQGYKQAFTTQAPSVTLFNGQTGYVSDTSQTPFVISVIPVVGNFAPGPQVPAVDPNAVDPRIQAMQQAQVDANEKADAQAAAQAKAGGAIPPLAQPQRQNNLAPRANSKPANEPERAANPAQAAAERLSAAQESSAGRPALSVAEAKRLRQQETAAADGEMAALMERARALEEDGKPNVAKIYYQRVAKHANGELQQQAQTRLYELQGAAKP